MIVLTAAWLCLNLPSDNAEISRALNHLFDRHEVCRVHVIRFSEIADVDVKGFEYRLQAIRNKEWLKNVINETVFYVDSKRSPEREPLAETIFFGGRSFVGFQDPERPGHVGNLDAQLENVDSIEIARQWALMPHLAFGNLWYGYRLVDAIDPKAEIVKSTFNNRDVVRVTTKNRFGVFNLWLDPVLQHLPLRATHDAEWNDQLPNGVVIAKLGPNASGHTKVAVSESISNVKHGFVDGRPVILGYTHESNEKYDDGTIKRYSDNYSISNWSFDKDIPDSEFKLTLKVPEGHPVNVSDRPTIIHEWRNGEIVKVRPAAAIRQMESVAIHPGDSSLAYWIGGGFALLLVALLIARWRLGVE